MTKFKAHTGHLIYKGLFYEQTGADKSGVLYTLKSHDHEGFPSLYRLYMEHDDPTEYSFAITCFDGWDHWEQLTKMGWFKPYLEKWRKELEIRVRSQALLQIRAKASTSDKEAYQAQKFLVSAGWKPSDARKGAGRPSKEEVAKAAENIAREGRDLEEEFNRVVGTVN